ncbi:MAG: hypothetical protein HY790_05880 [Deltaproteobacteria bacterium]|nr:hypothetical protein [Deltaproteobacteria bacterium]
MKTLRRVFFLALAAVCLFPLLASAAPPRKPAPYRRPTYNLEQILRFQSLVQVHPDATLTVTETIKVESAGVQIKRGIVRDFPTIYRDKSGKTVKVGFSTSTPSNTAPTGSWGFSLIMMNSTGTSPAMGGLFPLTAPRR